MMTRQINVNDIIIFNPESFESSRTLKYTDLIYCAGVDLWKDKMIPFVAIACTKDKISSAGLLPFEWIHVPCDPSNCMLVVDNCDTHIKLLPLNNDYRPFHPIDNYWILSSTLEHGLNMGIIQIMP